MMMARGRIPPEDIRLRRDLYLDAERDRTLYGDRGVGGRLTVGGLMRWLAAQPQDALVSATEDEVRTNRGARVPVVVR